MSQNLNLIIYAPHSIADNTGLPISKIWIPEPGTYPANTKGYAGIQHSWVGTVTGISNSQVDLDIFDSNVLLGNIAPPGPGTPENLTVYTIQCHLNTMTLAGLVADGILGPLTIGKIQQFEQIVGIVIDGIWGSQCANATAKRIIEINR